MTTTPPKRLTRHEMTEPDAFLTGLEQTFRYFREHPVQIAAGGLAVALALGIGLGTAGWLRSRERSASEGLAKLIETSERPVGTTAAQVKPGAPAPFADAAARDNAVLKEADEFLASGGSTRAARGGRLLKAQALARLGRAAEAQALFSEVAGSTPNDSLGLTAAFGRAAAQAAAGEVDSAVDALKLLASSNSPYVPKDLALKTAASILERAGKTGPALGLWRRLVEEVPDSPSAGEAKTKVEELSHTLQEALPAAAAPSPVPSH